MKVFGRLFFLVAFLALGCTVMGQTPCVTIESIFVDACTLGGTCTNASTPTCSCEGKNEMFRFRLGEQPQQVSNLVVNWPNNTFLGFCQDAVTAQSTEELNATIDACGWLLEPLDGVLPAHSSVLVVTSTDMCTAANSFAGLADTLYILYQCPGNFQGHFANFGTGLRTTTLTFGGGCNSTATYDRSLLVMQNGLLGAQDGASVDFDLGGNPTYYNNGCTAPILPSVVNAGSDLTGCAGEEINLQAVVSGAFTDYSWSGGSGTFADAANPQTTYAIGNNDEGSVVLTFSATDCNGTVSDALTVTIEAGETPDLVLSPSGSVVLCENESLLLVATSSSQVTWSDGSTGDVLEVGTPGTYTATATSACGSASESVTIEMGSLPEPVISPNPVPVFCAGSSETITVSGSGDVLWSTGATTPSIMVTEAGTYTVSLTNACGTSTVTFNVSVETEAPTASISPDAPSSCLNNLAELTGSGNGDFLWSTGSSTTTISAQEGEYSLTVTNACGSSTASVVVDFFQQPVLDLLTANYLVLCEGDELILQASSTTGAVVWNDGTEDPVMASITVTSAGVYTVTTENECGTLVEEVIVDESAINTSFDASNLQGNAPLDVFIGVEVFGSDSGSMNEWYIDGAPVFIENNFEFTFNEPGDYVVTLIVNDDGCQEVYTFIITVFDCEIDIVVPNIFSPNNDGINDRIRFDSECLVNATLDVFNRWGALVHQVGPGAGSWDGRDTGGRLFAEGVYFIVVRFTDLTGAAQQLTGHTTLVR